MEKVERLAVTGKLKLARHEACLFKLPQVKMEKRAADADLARELAHVGSAIPLKSFDDPQTMWVGQGSQRLQQTVSAALQLTLA